MLRSFSGLGTPHRGPRGARGRSQREARRTGLSPPTRCACISSFPRGAAKSPQVAPRSCLARRPRRRPRRGADRPLPRLRFARGREGRGVLTTGTASADCSLQRRDRGPGPIGASVDFGGGAPPRSAATCRMPLLPEYGLLALTVRNHRDARRSPRRASGAHRSGPRRVRSEWVRKRELRSPRSCLRKRDRIPCAPRMTS